MTLITIIVVASSLAVLIDTKRMGIRSGLIPGFFDMGPWLWFFACLLLWLVFFPMYLIKRGAYRDVLQANSELRHPPIRGFLVLGSLSIFVVVLVICGSYAIQQNSGDRRVAESSQPAVDYRNPTAALMDGQKAIGKTVALSGQALSVKNLDGKLYISIYTGGETWVLTVKSENVDNKNEISQAIQNHNELRNTCRLKALKPSPLCEAE